VGPETATNTSRLSLCLKSQGVKGSMARERLTRSAQRLGVISAAAAAEVLKTVMALVEMEWKSSERYSRGRSFLSLMARLFRMKSSSDIFFFTCGLWRSVLSMMSE